MENYQKKLTNGQVLNPFLANEVLEEILKPFKGSLIVTPREIDDLISNAAQTINRGITMALHPHVAIEDIET